MRNLSSFSGGMVLGLLAAAALGFTLADNTPDESSAKTFAGLPVRPDDGKLGVLVLGAHPDDCEIRAGGTGILWSDAGNHVKFVSLTNGDIGHWQMAGGPLAKRRFEETQAAAKILGVTTEVLDIHDGELMPTLENRKIVTRLIRQWNADIVIAHRPNDYHPDHRYTGVLMQDCAYMAAVPFLCPDTPPLKKNPVFLYSYDRFQLPTPFRPDVVVALDTVIDRKADALATMESQFVEGGAMGGPHRLPKSEEERSAARDRVRESFKRRAAGVADNCREKLIELYGKEQGEQVRYAEAFEICEYGRQPTKEELRKLFPLDVEKTPEPSKTTAMGTQPVPPPHRPLST
jgi:LmbE family N-acetylglucosaminyl deacetylase